MGTKKEKNCIIELWRFVAAIVIMILHARHIGFPAEHFSMGWIYVDFFFVITGYLTVKHFEDADSVSVDDAAKRSIKYTFSKFSKVIPYTTLSIIVLSIIDIMKNGIDAGKLINVIPEMSLLFQGENMLITLWFIRVLIIIFPLFCYICQKCCKNLLYVGAITYVLIYYNWMGVVHNHEIPLSLLRALAGLSLGIISYGIASLCSKYDMTKWKRVAFSIIEHSAYIFVFFATYTNRICFIPMIICMVVGIALSFSNATYTSKLRCPLFERLGSISMVIYIIHMPVGEVIKLIGIDGKNSLLIWCGVTIVMAFILKLIIDRMAINYKRS